MDPESVQMARAEIAALREMFRDPFMRRLLVRSRIRRGDLLGARAVLEGRMADFIHLMVLWHYGGRLPILPN